MSSYLQTILSSPGWSPRGMASIGGESFCLGLVFGASMILAAFVASLRPLLVFLALLSLFHMTEFMFAAVYHSFTCSTEAFLIPHSTAYSVAMVFSVVEYLVEWLLFGTWVNSRMLFYIGFCICVAGQLLRWAAFVTAGHNFTHLVAENKEAKHALVTGGVYKYVRHPGYCGWFWWSVGTQLMLANPISTLAFAYFSYRFFAERIPNEEAALSSPEFFGEQYKKYKAQTPTYIPFIA